jgi:hypothetical protein
VNDSILRLFHCHEDEDFSKKVRDQKNVRKRLEAIDIKYKSLRVGHDGTCYLNLSGTRITDLSSLKGLPVTHLCLQGCFGVADVSPLEELSLKWINLCRTNVTDLSPLRNLPLAHLPLYRTRITDLSPLKDVQLRSLDIRFTMITDLSPLRRMPLQELSFFPSRISKGMTCLRSVTTLKGINRRPATEFWRRYKTHAANRHTQ